jgi:Fur family peroxide stress response transcriptional regulator
MSRDVKSEIRDLFRRSSLRCTAQRCAMLEYLLHSPGHLTADQIFAGVNRLDSRASRATVYNNLHALVRAGALQELTLGGEAVRYDVNTEWHHHFICDRCGRLEDIEAFDVSHLLWQRQLGARIVRNHQILFRGVCEPCSQSSNTHGRRS